MLHTFERASGQKINEDKSSAFFSRNTGQEKIQEICHILNFQEANDDTMYLGLPSILGRNKSAIFGYLKDRLGDKNRGWDKKTISKGGKEVLLKTVAQALPNYAMSIFLLPQRVCSDMKRLMTRYWWKLDVNKDSGITWMSWDIMCSSKADGGMGFRNLRDFNLALMGKQGWCLISNENSLVSKVYNARYYPNDSFLTAKIGNNPSYVWRSILESQVLLNKGAVRRVGTGHNISILDDPWLPDAVDPYIRTSSDAIQNEKVVSLMVTGYNEWDTYLINDIF